MDVATLAADLRVPDDEAVTLLLSRMVDLRWRFHYLGAESRRPNAIVAKYEWIERGYADLVILHGPDDAIAYRAPTRDEHGAGLDILAPDWTVHDYRSIPRWTLRYALTLDPPRPDEHDFLRPAPAFCAVDPRDRKPMTIRV